MLKKLLTSFSIILIIVLITIVILPIYSVLFAPESFYSILPYNNVDHWLLYDHIEYNGVDYFWYEADLRPDNVIPDFGKEIDISIVNSKCEPYDETRFGTAYLCQNDDNNIYIYYDSCYFVSDKSLASEPWNDKETEDGSVPCEKNS